MQVETIYRAKKIDSDEWVKGKGVLDYFNGQKDVLIAEDGYSKIDKSTLSIHFTNSGMNDSDGTPIFASLSSDGNGGTKFEYVESKQDNYFIAIIIKGSFFVHDTLYKIGSGNSLWGMEKWVMNCKVTGIHAIEGEG